MMDAIFYVKQAIKKLQLSLTATELNAFTTSEQQQILEALKLLRTALNNK